MGPVINNIYQWLKGFVSYTISSFDVDKELEDIFDNVKDFLDNIWKKYSKYSASFLVNKTHEPDSPWYAVYHEHSSKIIDIEKLAVVKLQNAWK